MQQKINSFQLFCILFISRLLGTFTYMVRSNSALSAGGRIVMMLLFFLFSAAFSVPLLLYLNKQNNTSMLNSIGFLSDQPRKIVSVCYAAVFLLSAIISVTRFGLFASTVLLQNTSLYVFIFSLLLVSVYCACKGLQPMARTAVIFAFILSVSLLFIQTGVLHEFQLTNIAPFRKNQWSDVLKQALFSACRNIEIPAILFIAEKIKGSIKKTVLCFLIFFSFVTALLFSVSGGVTGEYGEIQIFPLFTLSSLAKLGFLERMEDLLTGIWVVCAMIKIAFLLYVSALCLQNARQKEMNKTTTATAGLIVFAGYLLLSSDIAQTVRLLQSWILPVGFLVFGVLLPTILYSFAMRKEKQMQKERKT